MWRLALICDGCGATGARTDAPHSHSAAYVLALAASGVDRSYLRSDLTIAAAGLKEDAERLRWERERSADGESWYCPVCALARTGYPLTPEKTHAHGPT